MLTKVKWEDKEDQEAVVNRRRVLHMVTHVMVTEGMLITLLNHQLMENHDRYHREHHTADEMAWFEFKLISSGSASGH